MPTDHLTPERERAVLDEGPRRTRPTAGTFARRFVRNHVDAIAAVVTTAGGRTRRTPDLALADLGRAAAIYNSSTLLRPTALHNLDATLAEINAFHECGTGPVYLWSPWPTPDLRHRGWHLEGHPPLLARPAGGPLPETPDVRIDVVDDADAARTWERIVVDGFPFTETQPHLPGAFLHSGLLADRRWRLWLAFDDTDTPVTAAGSFVAHGIHQFAFGVTLPEARRQGHWYAVVRERLLAYPHLPVAGIFTGDSQPGAQRIGFQPVTHFTVWSRTR